MQVLDYVHLDCSVVNTFYYFVDSMVYFRASKMKCEYTAGTRTCDKPAWVREVEGQALCRRHYMVVRRGIEYVKKMEQFIPELRIER